MPPRLGSSGCRCSLALVGTLSACTGRAAERPVDRDRAQPELVVQQASPGTFVAFSPDDRFIATTTADATTLWETSTGRLVRELQGVQRDVIESGASGATARRVSFGAGGQQVVFSPDGRYVAALPITTKRAMDITDWRSAQAPAIWEVATGRPLTSSAWRLEEGNLRNPTLSFSLSELLAWSSVSDDSAGRRVVTDARALRAVSADGRHVATVEEARPPFTLRVRELPSGRVIASLPETYDDAQLVALSPDAQWLAVRTKGAAVDLWNVASLQKVATLAKDAATSVAPRSIAFSADSKLLAIGGNRLQIVRVADRALLADQAFETALGEGITELAFSHDGTAIAGTGASLRLFAVPSGNLLRELQPPTLLPVVEWAASSSAIALVRQRTPDEFAGRDYHGGSVELWPLDSGAPRMLDTALQHVASLSFSADGRWLAAAMQQQTIVSRYTNTLVGDVALWSLPDARRVLPSDADAQRPTSQLVFSPDDSALLAVRLVAVPTSRECAYVECGEDEHTDFTGWLDRIDLATRREHRLTRLGRTTTAGGEAYFVAPAGNRVVTYDQQSARLTSLGAAAPETSASSPTSMAWPCQREECLLRWSADGAFLAIAAKHTVHLMEGSTGALVLEHDVQSDTVDVTIRAVRFIPGDSAELAVLAVRDVGAGSTLYRMDVRSGAVRAMMRFPESLDDILFASGNRVLARSRSVVRVYDAGGTMLASLIRSAAGRWAVVTPDGLYDGVGGGPELFVWRVGSTLVAPGELPARFHVPGLLQRLMRGEKIVAPPWP